MLPRPRKRRTDPGQTTESPLESSSDQPSEETSAFMEGDRRHAMIGRERDDCPTAESNVEQVLADSEEPPLCEE